MKALALLLLLAAALPAAAALRFEAPSIKAEANLDDKFITRDFKFTNSGDKAVTIREADAGCSCLAIQVAGGKLNYAPGETGTLRAVFELGSFQGTVEKQINVWLEGDPEEKPSTTLSMSVHIPVIISVEPKSVKWQVGGPADMQVIEVTMDYGKPIRVTSVATGNDMFSAELVTIEEGKRYAIQVKPAKGTDAGGLAVVRIETDVDVEKQRVQQAFAVISAPIGKR
ncbi:DUF1573 domain-containing protein [Akkermansiaceae bacterium]|nr:DUF1573 domain-containing protein [Akkermansiaceae bacterium]